MFVEFLLYMAVAVFIMVLTVGLCFLASLVYRTLKKPIPGPRETLESTRPKHMGSERNG